MRLQPRGVGLRLFKLLQHREQAGRRFLKRAKVVNGRALESPLQFGEELADPLLIDLAQRLQHAVVQVLLHPFLHGLHQIVRLGRLLLRLRERRAC